MEPLETLQALELAIKILKEIDTMSVDDDVKATVKKKVVQIINEIAKPKQRAAGSQQKIIESLRKLGGSAVRSAIADDTGLDPNVVSSLLSKLVKLGKVKKVRIGGGDGNTRKGRGLEPEYLYTLVDDRREQ
jgi:DNA-binding transcriptional ArsR family regulator